MLHLDPFTVPVTVTVAPVESLALIAARVDVPVRTFTPSQAGVIALVVDVTGGVGDGFGVAVGFGVGEGAGVNDVDPLFEKRQAKYVFVVPGTVAVPQPKRRYAPSSDDRWGAELMKLRCAT